MSKSFTYEVLTLYRREDIWIKCEFDDDQSEGSRNSHMIQVYPHTAIVDEYDPKRTVYHYDPDFVAKNTKTINNDGTYYWSLVSNGGWFEIKIKNEFNPYCLMEVSYDFANPGVGQLDIWINSVLTEVRKGPSSWSSSVAHKAGGFLNMKFRQRNFGLSDPPGRAEIDNLCIYKYNKINCDLFDYTPARAMNNPRQVDTIRGYTQFQTTKYVSTQFQSTLRFNSADEHTDFVKNIEYPHVLIDEKGMFYRGVIELGEVEYRGMNLYEQQIIFKSPNKLGEGWI